MGEKKPKDSNSTEIESTEYTVIFSSEFDYYYNNVCTENQLDLIDDFIEHYERNGLKNWKGKIACSSNVPNYYKDHNERKSLAIQYNLKHVHIGYPEWITKEGYTYSTSDQVIHFQKISYKEIKLLTLSRHRPMELPTLENIQDDENG